MKEPIQWAELSKLRPEELVGMLTAHPIAYLPSGVIEWHDAQNPLGTDTLKMAAICRRTAARTGGVVLPPSYVGTGVLVHPPTDMPYGGLNFSAELVGRYLEEMFTQLEALGFSLIVLCYGHTSAENINAHEVTARDYMLREDTQTKVLCLTDYGPAVRHRYRARDHAAKWETSFMMASYPDRVRMEAIAEDHGPWHGLDPRLHASSREGESMYNHVAEESARLVEMALAAPRAALVNWTFIETTECWKDCRNIEELKADLWQGDDLWEDPWCDFCLWRAPGLIRFLTELKGRDWMRRRAEVWMSRVRYYPCQADRLRAAIQEEFGGL